VTHPEPGPLRRVTRAGLAANGVLHLLVAYLALRVAMGYTARADQAGAFQAVAAEPLGRPLLWLLVAGFAAVVIWRVREAVWGFHYVRDDKKRTTKRLFSAVQALVYIALGLLAARVATGSPAGNGGSGITAAVLRLPWGRPLVVAIGAGIVVLGAGMAIQGCRKRFTEDMDLDQASPRTRTVAVRVGQIGSVAKGLAFMIVGGLVASAAMNHRPEQAEGLDAALKTIAGQPYGRIALLVVAAGVACFGVFLFFDSRYHRVA
jgi:hypothetical protein